MSSLGELLAAEADAVAGFVRLLSEEQEALKSANADLLAPILERKNAAVPTLAELARRRGGALAALGFSGAQTKTDDWLATRPDLAACRQHWQRLQSLAAEARELNRLNGELIRLRMSHNAQLLEALLAANRMELYGADGQTSSVAARRIIDSA